MALPRYGFSIFPRRTITTAGTVVGIPFAVRDVKHLEVEAKFNFGAGGTQVLVFVQTSIDGGVSFFDIMNIRFTNATANRISSVHRDTSVAAAITPLNLTLANNQILNGLIGDRVRVVIVTTGTYAPNGGDDTSLEVQAVAHK